MDEWGADVVSNVDFEESFGRGEDGFGDFMGEVCFYNGYFHFLNLCIFAFFNEIYLYSRESNENMILHIGINYLRPSISDDICYCNISEQKVTGLTF